jgi:hypothetical protein
MRIALRAALRLIPVVALGLSILLPAGRADAGLVSYWAGDGNADDSVGSNSGTLVDGVTFGPGVAGQAFSFDGASYVQAPTIGLPTGDQDRTLNLWFKVNAFGAGESFLAGYGDFGASSSTYQLGLLDDGSVYFSQWGDAVIGPKIQAGTWHTLGVTNSGDSVTLYLDGIAVGAGSMSINTAANTDFYIGRLPGALGDTRQLDGLVDEVRVYDTALTASEMRALATIPEPASLVLMGLGIAGLAALTRRRFRSRGDALR